MTMNSYTKKSPPSSGNALKIWNVIGNDLKELHYNPNLYGKASINGWGTWACTFDNGDMYWCGIDINGVYLQQMQAPYDRKYIKNKIKKNGE